MGKKQRPIELQVRASLGWEKLQPIQHELDIELTMKEALEPIANIVEHLAQSMGGEQPPALVELPGVTVEQIGRFYEAAAEFYKSFTVPTAAGERNVTLAWERMD